MLPTDVVATVPEAVAENLLTKQAREIHGKLGGELRGSMCPQCNCLSGPSSAYLCALTYVPLVFIVTKPVMLVGKPQ